MHGASFPISEQPQLVRAELYVHDKYFYDVYIYISYFSLDVFLMHIASSPISEPSQLVMQPSLHDPSEIIFKGL